MTADTCRFCGAQISWHACGVCGGEGVDGHDCGDDACCCAEPLDNVTCEQCGGEGGWEVHDGACESISALRARAEQAEAAVREIQEGVESRSLLDFELLDIILRALAERPSR